MANAAGLIHESIWRDEDYRNLSRAACAPCNRAKSFNLPKGQAD